MKAQMKEKLMMQCWLAAGHEEQLYWRVLYPGSVVIRIFSLASMTSNLKSLLVRLRLLVRQRLLKLVLPLFYRKKIQYFTLVIC